MWGGVGRKEEHSPLVFSVLFCFVLFCFVLFCFVLSCSALSLPPLPPALPLSPSPCPLLLSFSHPSSYPSTLPAPPCAADLKAFRQKQELVRRHSGEEGIGAGAAVGSTESETGSGSGSGTWSGSGSGAIAREDGGASAAAALGSAGTLDFRSALLKRKEALLSSLAEVERLLSQ